MCGNNIGAAGAEYIFDALKKNTSLTSLDLGGNNIGAAGAKYIFYALKENTSLTTLYLRDNNIGAAGAKYIADALKENTSLTTLYLSSNNIGDAGAKYIADALKENTSLTTLDLFGNNIGDAGAKDIAEALKVNTSLTSLDLINNNIGSAGAKAIADALKDSNILKYNGRNTELHKTLTEFIDNSKSNEYSEILFGYELILNKNVALSELLKDSKYSSEGYNKLKYLVANPKHIDHCINSSSDIENPDLSTFDGIVNGVGLVGEAPEVGE